MIEKAVQRRPNDGAIVDSLGWVMLRQGEVTRGGQDAGARGRAGSGGPVDQRPSWRCILGGRAQAGGDLPVAARADVQSGARRRGEAGGEAAGRWPPVDGGQRPVGLVPDRPDRAGAGQGQSVPACAGRRADGYHLLDSLVVFAECRRHTDARSPAETLSLGIAGPFAAALAADQDNLVLRAARALAAEAGVRRARSSGLGQASAGGLRHRRRVGGRCGGAAAAVPPVATTRQPPSLPPGGAARCGCPGLPAGRPAAHGWRR